MPKFRVEIVETYRRYIEVEAVDEDVAYQEIDDKIVGGEIDLPCDGEDYKYDRELFVSKLFVSEVKEKNERRRIENMSNNINVINKAEKDLDIMVNNVDGNIEIVIMKKKIDIDLLTLKPGEVFKINGVEYIALEQLDNNQTAVIRKELLEEKMMFDSDNNNWKISGIRKRLNEEYLKEIENAFGKDKIVDHTVDLLSLDGLEDYGTSIDKVSLLTIDQYRKYRRILGENLDSWWWLVTPDSTPTGFGSVYVRYVDSGGDVGYSDCSWDGGVRPFFILQS